MVGQLIAGHRHEVLAGDLQVVTDEVELAASEAMHILRRSLKPPRPLAFLQYLKLELVQEFDGMAPDAALISLKPAYRRKRPAHRPILIQFWSSEKEHSVYC